MSRAFFLSTCLDHGVELERDEIVAIVQQVLDCGIAKRAADGPFDSEVAIEASGERGALGLASVSLDADGAVRCEPDVGSVTLSDIGQLLNALLTACRKPGTGPLRYATARALGEGVAPPFGSLEELTANLRRFETRDRSEVLRSLYTRAAPYMTATVVAFAPPPAAPAPPRPDRRRTMTSASDLRRYLREADQQIYELLAAQALRAQAQQSRTRLLGTAGRWIAAVSIVGAACALLFLRPYWSTTPPSDRGQIIVQPPEQTVTDRSSRGQLDPQARRPAAAATPSARVAPIVTRALSGRAFSPSFAADGASLFFHTGRTADQRSALMVDDLSADSQPMAVLDDGARNFHVQLSPDGTRIAYDSDRDGERAIYIAERDGSNPQRVAVEGYAAVPTWAPDSERLAFVRAEDTTKNVWNLWLLTVKSGDVRRLTHVRFGQTWGASWFADGRRVGYSHEDAFFVLTIDTGQTRKYRSPVPGRLLRTPAVSPDGTQAIFQVQNSGTWLLDLATGASRLLMADRSAEEFAWSRDGRHVAFHSRRTGDWGIWILEL